MNASTATAPKPQSIPVRLFFDQTKDEHFLVLAEISSPNDPDLPGDFSVHTFEHEDRFLEKVGAADLTLSDMTLLAGTVLRSLGEAMRSCNWVELNLTQEQIVDLGLKQEKPLTYEELTRSTPDPLLTANAFEFTENSGQFYQFLMHSPTPFVMLSGPEHRFTFINQPFAELIGQAARQDILMKTIREVLPELEGQPFFGWLDQVYETGTLLIRSEQRAHMRLPHSPELEDRYFDFVYYPVCNATGHVYGVMIQAADVTERVQSRAMTEARETRLFELWAEIESIYRKAPIGLALLEIDTLRIMRINEKQAALMGASIVDLLGKKVAELDFLPQELKLLFESIATGETLRNCLVHNKIRAASSQGERTWLVNISPLGGASGEVLAYTSISLEVPD